MVYLIGLHSELEHHLARRKFGRVWRRYRSQTSECCHTFVCLTSLMPLCCLLSFSLYTQRSVLLFFLCRFFSRRTENEITVFDTIINKVIHIWLCRRCVQLLVYLKFECSTITFTLVAFDINCVIWWDIKRTCTEMSRYEFRNSYRSMLLRNKSW